MGRPPVVRERLEHIDLVATIRRHVDDCIRRGLQPSVGAAATLAGTGPMQLARYVRAFDDTSPLEVIHARQIEHAVKLLRRPSLTIRDIASRTGFGSRRNFDRIFRRYTGTSAEEWRNQR